MKILIVNPIMYSCENKRVVPRVDSVRDTLLCNLCKAFCKKGHEVVLYTTDIYKPRFNEELGFKIIWDKPILKSIFLPACFPFHSGLKRYITHNIKEYDMVISSEVFQWSSLICSLYAHSKTVIWHETARHNRILKTIPSMFWYNIIAKMFFRKTLVVPRSIEAQSFVKKYLCNVTDEIIEHGIDDESFVPVKKKDRYFIVVSQLIERKHVEKIIEKFDNFTLNNKDNGDYKLMICGEGVKEQELKALCDKIKSGKRIDFKGKLAHSDLIPLISHAKALLINSEKENSMVSIIESIAVGTPIITTSAPLNSSYIKTYKLGIVDDNWNQEEMIEVISENESYVNNCINYRNKLLNSSKVDEFINVYKKYIRSM